MKRSQSRRVAAVLGALAAHGETEKQPETLAPPPPPVIRPNLWGLASRQARMGQRQFWEYRYRR